MFWTFPEVVCAKEFASSTSQFLWVSASKLSHTPHSLTLLHSCTASGIPGGNRNPLLKRHKTESSIALCQYHTISQDKSKHLVLNLSLSQTKLEMLHLLSLFVLPSLLPTAEAKGAFLYFCFGEGCSGWDLALSCISVLFTMCCFLSAISSCCKGNVKNEEAEFRTETVWMAELKKLVQ